MNLPHVDIEIVNSAWHFCWLVLGVTPGANEESEGKGVTKMASGRLEVSISSR